MGALWREAGVIVPGRYYLVSWRTCTPHPGPWPQCCSPVVNLQTEYFLREPLRLRAGARSGPATSQVASISCRLAQDSRAPNPKVYWAAAFTRAQGCKKQNWGFQNLLFSLAFVLLPTPGLSISFLISASPSCESPMVWALYLLFPYSPSFLGSGLLSPP